MITTPAAADPLAALLARLPDARRAGAGWLARCPAHDDRRASLSIAAGDDGRALVRCHAGCSAEAVCAAVGLRLADLMPPALRRAGPPGPHRTSPPRGGRPADRDGGWRYATLPAALAAAGRGLGPLVARWLYRGADGRIVGAVARWDTPRGKEVRPLARGADGWRVGAMPEPRPLYGLRCVLRAAADEVVWVAEGERCAVALRRLGLVACTSAGGAQAAAKTDWGPLRGRDVVVLPDHDAAGERYAGDVVRLARAAGARSVRVVRLAEHAPGLPDGGDIADVLADGRWCGLPLAEAAGLDDLAALLARLAAEAEPAEADAPPAEDLAWRPFPAESLPEPLRGFVLAGAKAIACDPAYVALPALAVLASAIGTTRRLLLKRGWSAPPILWTAIVGESGTAKTPALRLALRPLHEHQRRDLEAHAEAMRRYQADLARYEVDMAAWKKHKGATTDPPERPEEPQARRCLVRDTTIEALAPILLANPRGLLLARDELAGWVGSFDRYAAGGKVGVGADAAHWLSMHSGEGITVDRKTGHPRTIHVPQAAVCITGGIQPGILRRALSREHRESGLAARLLLASPPRLPRRWTEADIAPEAEAAYARLLDRLLDLRPALDEEGQPRPVLVRLTPAAKAAWCAYFDAHAREQADLTGDLAAAWAKLEEGAARLALVVHLIRWAADDPTLAGPDDLDEGSMAAGIALAAWAKHEARRAYALLDESPRDADRRRLLEWLARRGGSATAREVQQGCRWLREPGAAESALQALAEAGLGAWRTDAPSRGGHTTRRFGLSTLSTVDARPRNPGKSGASVDTVDAANAALAEAAEEARAAWL